MADQCYMCIDLAKFYASAECAARGLDPNTTDLVVADESRGKGAICLAVSPAIHKKGVKNRCRLYEIPDNLDYIIAKPRMRMYMNISAHIYGIYKKFVAAEDVYPYSIDEVFLNAGPYLSLYKIWLSLLLTMSFTAYYRQFREQRILGFQGAEPLDPRRVSLFRSVSLRHLKNSAFSW